MCEYCEKGRSLPVIYPVEDIDAYVAGATLNVFFAYAIFGEEASREIKCNINYCPMCGQKLGGDGE